MNGGVSDLQGHYFYPVNSTIKTKAHGCARLELKVN
jgi:hypothetical protein